MKDNLDETTYSYYIDNEYMCQILGIPCKCGIPNCFKCREADKFVRKNGDIKEIGYGL